VTKPDPIDDEPEPVWRQRAVSRTLDSARARAEQRAQHILDAAFDLMDENGTTDFAILDVVSRAKQSLRSFYQCFESKDELLLALFEETIRQAVDELRTAVDAEGEPLTRLRAFVISLHDQCDPDFSLRRPDMHNRRPISEFSLQLARSHPEQVQAMFAPISQLLAELINAAKRPDLVDWPDTRTATALVLRAVIYSWFEDRLSRSAGLRISAEDSWRFCLHALRGHSS
jgi:AcrR family transcriptional regulator